MANLTLSIDEHDLKHARIQALQDGTSLNAVIRKFVKSYIEETKHYQRVTDRLLEQADISTYERGNTTQARDALYK